MKKLGDLLKQSLLDSDEKNKLVERISKLPYYAKKLYQFGYNIDTLEKTDESVLRLTYLAKII